MPFPEEPPPFVELSGGLSLRELQTNHAPNVFAAMDSSREHLRTWLPWVDSTFDEHDTHEFLQEVQTKRAQHQTVAYGLWLQGSLRGLIGMHDISLSNANLQLGYWLNRDSEGRGLMTMACAALLAIAFDTLRMERVEIRCAEGNTRSWAIPERLGFSLEGTLRRAQHLNGEFVDMRLYSMLERDYRRLMRLAVSHQ